MARILHVQASPRGDESYSLRVAEALLAAAASARPDVEIDTLDLFAAELPAFAAPAARAKYAVLGGQEPADEAGRAWQEVIAVVERFKSADAYVLSVPLWNFSIPYRLKHYLDVIVQPGLTFAFSPAEGYTGSVTGRPAALVLARGGAYSEGSGMEAYDFQRPYLEGILAFLGFTDVRTIVVEPTMAAGADVAAQVLARAEEQARRAGEELARKL